MKSEKNYLELALAENKEQKEFFKEKSEKLHKMHEEVYIEIIEYKKQHVGIQEIKKDRDDRIERLREEFDQISQKYEELDKVHTTTSIQYEQLKLSHSNLLNDYDAVTEKLKLSNKLRNQKEE